MLPTRVRNVESSRSPADRCEIHVRPDRPEFRRQYRHSPKGSGPDSDAPGAQDTRATERWRHKVLAFPLDPAAGETQRTAVIGSRTLPALQPVDPHLLTKNSVVDPAQDRQDLTLLRSIARGGKLLRSGLAENRQGPI